MNIPKFITQNKEPILDSVDTLINAYRPVFNHDNELIPTSIDMLLSFIKAGKCMRGSLVLTATHIYGGEKEDALKLAAAIEILHSALLIHDDIMDNDRLRRGKPTILAQYEDRAQKKGFSFPTDCGHAMAICLGDISFFLAQNIINSLTCKEETKRQLIDYISKELMYVGFAQMQDCEFACSSTMPTEEEIMSLYKFKTGRYTFVLPIVSGAILSGKSLLELEKIEKMAEELGVLFQLKDDEIGMFSHDSVSGKPQGSDIREGKKTLLYAQILIRANAKQKKQFEKMFGKKKLSAVELKELYTIVNSLKIYEYSRYIIDRLARSVSKSIEQLDILNEHKTVFKQVLEYNVQRDS